jgi:opacity protein-like surface antigen
MSKARLFLSSALALPLLISAIPDAKASGNIDLFVGQKELDEDFGAGNDIQEQDFVGIMFDWGKETWPVHIALDFMTGSDDVDDDDLDVHLDGSTAEILLGVRWYPAKESGSHWMPHLGGGLGLVSGEVSEDFPDASNDISFDDSKLGFWADAGLQYRFGEHFKIGARLKYSKAKVDNPGGDVEEVEAGGFAYGIDGGWTW